MSSSRLVNKKFNSTINVYTRPIQETLEHRTEVLSNDAIKNKLNQFSECTIKNSSILKNLEDEKKKIQAGLRRIVWPPQQREEKYCNSIKYSLAEEKDQQLSRNYYELPNVLSQYQPLSSIKSLRSEPPTSQEHLPIYQTQPAATNPNTGSMRGDLKWPPPLIKKQTDLENRTYIELTKGPMIHSRRINKDYTDFFAQHVNPNIYLRYRVPPGTQYFTPN